MEIKKESRKIVIEEVTLWKSAAIILGLLFLISTFTGGFGGSKAKTIVADSLAPQQAPTYAPAEKVDVDITGEPTLGNKNAKITIVEFTDFQCPFCKRAFDQTFSVIKKDYIDTGKVFYVVRDYPLPFHNEADEAASAANCAFQQDEEKYWEMHEMLFANQQAWSGSLNAITTFKEYANQLGLDAKEFDSCMTNPSTRAEIDADIDAGGQYGVSGTPSFFINGIPLVGAQPISAFRTAIEAELQ